MANKEYKYLKEEDKKKVREEFKKTKRGASVLPILNRLILEGIVCVLLAIYLLVYTFIKKGEWWNYTLAAMLLIAGVVFLIAQLNLRIKNYNIYLNTKRK